MTTINQLLLTAVVAAALHCSTVTASRILMLPLSHGSHVNFFTAVGTTLKSAGHEVYVLTGPKYQSFVTDAGLHSLCSTLTTEPMLVEQLVNQSHDMLSMMSHVKKEITVMKNFTRYTFADKTLMQKLNTLKFDLAVIDSLDIGRFNYLIPYKLSLPYITLAPRPDPWSSRVSSLPSIEGLWPMIVLTEDSTVFHRAANTMAYFMGMLFSPQSYISPMNDDSMFIDLVPEKENVGLNELYLQSEMVLVNMDIICLDSPRVSSLHYQHVGSIAAKPAKPLPPDMEKFVSAAKHGVVVVSFGSAVPSLPEDKLEKMISAFSRIKQHVLIRHSGDIPKNMPKNVFTSKWLPQNDLLGHPNTKLFITHAGNNGQLEAVYHGIPMLSMPLFFDQSFNARRAEVRGYGKTLDPKDFTAQQLEDMIIELTENKAYYNNIQKCSKILRDLPSAQETILFWVDHILKFGGSHLKPYYLRMPLWKFLMFDVAILFVVVVTSLWCILRYCCMKCCKRQKHQKVD